MRVRTMIEVARKTVAPARPRGPRFGERVPAAVAGGLGLAWVVALAVILGLEPDPDPEAPVDAVALVVGLAFTNAVFATAIGLGSARRWGVLASLGGGLVLAFGAATCMLTGHSGLWLTAQLAGGAGLALLSWGAWRAT